MIGAGSLRKGWCPGALRPMQAKDGLLVRLKPSCGVLPAAHAQELADFSQQYGNGLLELTSRGNLQIRGVRHDTLAALQTRLGELGFLDSSPEAEAIRNILISPMHGQSERADIASLAKELESELRDNHALHTLPPKFSFLIDDGSLPSLYDVAADVRFCFSRQPDIFSVWIGGTGAAAFYLGDCSAAKLVVCATGIAQRFLSLKSRYEASHMRELMSRLAPSEVTETFGFSNSSLSPKVQKIDTIPIGLMKLEVQNVLGLGLPFGRFTSFMLEAAASLSDRLGSGEIRLTPFRAILIPGVKTSDLTARFADLTETGFIVEPHDPRVKIAACGGQPACEQATTSTLVDGLALAEITGSLTSSGNHIHISGCRKGCAHPAPAPFTLVANAGLYDVVVNGTAADIPVAEGLNLTQIKSFMEKQLENEAIA